ncbi:hypothetical protein FNF27_06426 [Cafeteria roenbergensis]|uniref:PKD/REJ-like domain-containing protein n=1 Tax=Cafeteria roenbergensis TaxID=33653 RepID=A0A5A8E0F5_CAFRO|nr:hypothetical protein FNF27_06426 [Cafeteria roenbergensis]
MTYGWAVPVVVTAAEQLEAASASRFQNGTAIPRLAVSPPSVTIKPGELSATFSVGAIDDATVIGATVQALLLVTMATHPEGTDLPGVPVPASTVSLSFSVEDNDSPKLGLLSSASVNAIEGSTYSVTVQLATQPTAAVRVEAHAVNVTSFSDIASASPAPNLSPSSIAVAPGNWSKALQFSVTVPSNGLVDAGGSFAIVFSSVSAGVSSTWSSVFALSFASTPVVLVKVTDADGEQAALQRLRLSATGEPDTGSGSADMAAAGTVALTEGGSTGSSMALALRLAAAPATDVFVLGAVSLAASPKSSTWDAASLVAVPSLSVSSGSVPASAKATIDKLALEGFVVVAVFNSSSFATASRVALSAPRDSVLVTDGPVVQQLALRTVTGYADAYNGLVSTTAVPITVADVDQASLRLSATSINPQEGSPAATYRVMLATKPFGAVTVAIASSASPSDITISPATVTLTASNWNSGVQVSVLAVSDGVEESPIEYATVTHTVQSASADGDAAYRTLAPLSLPTNITDEVQVSLAVASPASLAGQYVDSPAAGDVAEGASITYTVKLVVPPRLATDVVTITLSEELSAARAAGANTPQLDVTMPSSRSLVFTQANWATPQQVVVKVLDNDIANVPRRLVRLVHTAVSTDLRFQGRYVPPLELTVIDDETPGLVLAVSAGEAKAATAASDVGADIAWGPQTTAGAAAKNAATSALSSIGVPSAGLAAAGARATLAAVGELVQGAAASSAGVVVKVSLAARPAGSVLVSLTDVAGAAGLGSDVLASATKLTFSTDTWSTPQTVTLRASQGSTGNRLGPRARLVVFNSSSAGAASAGSDVVYGSLAAVPARVVALGLFDAPSVQAQLFAAASTQADPALLSTSLTAQGSAVSSISLSEAASAVDGGSRSTTVSGAAVLRVRLSAPPSAAEATTTVNITRTVTGPALLLAAGAAAALSKPAEAAKLPSGSSAGAVASALLPQLAVGASALSFSRANWAEWQDVAVRVVDDSLVETDTEPASVSLAAVAQLAGSAAAKANARYTSALSAAEQTISVKVTVADDDSASLQLSRSSLAIAEGSSASFSFRGAAQPLPGVVPQLAIVANRTDALAVALSRKSSDLSFLTWDLLKAVTMSATEDFVDAGASYADAVTVNPTSVTLSAFGSSSPYTAAGASVAAAAVAPWAAMASKRVQVTVSDNDEAAVVLLPSSASVSEGETARFFVRLATVPTGTVHVGISAGTARPQAAAVAAAVSGAGSGATLHNASLGAVSPAALTFTSANWNQAQVVSVPATQDDVALQAPAVQAASLSLRVAAASSTAAEYRGLPALTGDVVVRDDDFAGVSVSPAAVTVLEALPEESAVVTVTLGSRPLSDVVVTATLSDSAQATVTPASRTIPASDAAAWRTGVSFAVSAINEGVAEADLHGVSLSWTVQSADTQYAGLAAAAVAVSIVDAGQRVDETAAPIATRAFFVESAHEVALTFASATDTAGMGVPASGAAAAVPCSSAALFDARTLAALSTATGSAVTASRTTDVSKPYPAAAATSASAGLSFPSQPLCYWASTSELRVRLPAGVLPRDGTAIETATATPTSSALSGAAPLRLVAGRVRAAGHSESIRTSSATLVVAGRLLVPRASRAFFAASGGSAVVEFSASTSQQVGSTGGSSGLCSLLFTNTNLGPTSGTSAARCAWTDDRTLSVVFGVSASVEPLVPFDALASCSNDKGLTARQGAVRATQSSVNSAAGCVLLRAPLETPPAPVAVLLAPQAIGPCDSVQLDATTSTGGGGRPMRFEWTAAVDSAQITSAVNLQAASASLPAIQAALDVASEADQGRVTLDGALLPGGSAFSFTVVAGHFLSSQTGNRTLAVRVAEEPVPSNQIDGAAVRTIRRDQSLRLSMFARASSCGDDDSAGKQLGYVWRLVSAQRDTATTASGYQVVAPSPSVVQTWVGSQPRVLVIPAGALQAGGRYVLEGVARVANKPAVNNSATVQVIVEGSAVASGIAGGSRSVGTDSGVTLDAGSLSFDPDGFDAAAPFRFNWTCVDATDEAALLAAAAAAQDANSIVADGVVVSAGETEVSVQLPQCPTTTAGVNLTFAGTLAAGTASGPGSVVDPAAGTLAVSSGVLVPGRRYRFGVQAYKGQAGGLIPLSFRSASSSVDIDVTAGAPPVVKATVVAGAVGTGTTSDGAVKVDASRRVILQGSATATVGGALGFSWELVGQSTELQAAAFATSTSAARVTLSPGVLPEGASLVFKLTVTDATGQAGSATVQLRTNEPPYAGFVQASPEAGTVLATSFTLQASQWTDNAEDLPLSYLFGFYRATPAAVLAAAEAGTSASVPFTPLGAAFQSSPLLENAPLPQGAGAGHNLTIAVRVRDALGAVVESFAGQDGQPVTVSVAPPSTTDSSAVSQLVASASAGLQDSLDAGNTAELLQSIAVLADVLSGTDPCDACSATEDCSAGQCVPQPSPSPSPSPAAAASPGASPLPSATPTPSPAARCPGSTRSLAGGSNPYQIPAVECSGHGSCVRSPALCSEDDTRGCSATCVCDEGWGRRDCLLSAAELQQVQAQKAQFVELQARALETIEASDAAVAQQTETLSALSSDAAELTEAAQDGVLSIAETLAGTLLPKDGEDSASAGKDALSEATGQKLLSVMASVGLSGADVNAGQFTSSTGSASRRRRMQAAQEAELLKEPAARFAWAAQLLAAGRAEAPAERLARTSRLLEATASEVNLTAVAAAVARAKELTARARLAVDSVARAVALNVQPGEAASVIQGTGVTVSTRRSDAASASDTALPSGASFSLGGAAGSLGGSGPVDLRAVSWDSNPYAWAAAAALVNSTGRAAGGGLEARSAAVISLTVANATGDGAEVPVKGLATPVEVRMPVAVGTAASKFECAFWDAATESWSRQGMVLVDMVQGTGNDTTWTAVCASTHLTGFAADLRAPAVEFNSINPFTDAGLLKNYLEPNNLFPLVVLSVMLSAFVMAWGVSALCDWRCRTDLRALRRTHFLRFGEVRPEAGNGELHHEEASKQLAEAQELAAKRSAALAMRSRTPGSGSAEASSPTGAPADSAQAQAPTPAPTPAGGKPAAAGAAAEYVPSRTRFLRSAKKKGTFFLVVQHICLDWVDRMRRNHPWGSAFASTLDEQLVMTRPQRIATLASSVLVAMAVAAFFFGRTPGTLESRLLISLIGAMAMLPTDRGFPWLFGKANSFKSRTVELVERRRIPMWRRLLCGTKYKSNAAERMRKEREAGKPGGQSQVRVVPASATALPSPSSSKPGAAAGQRDATESAGELRAAPPRGFAELDDADAAAAGGAAAAPAAVSKPEPVATTIVPAAQPAPAGSAGAEAPAAEEEAVSAEAANSATIAAVSKAIRSAAAMDKGCASMTVEEALGLLGVTRSAEGMAKGPAAGVVAAALATLSRGVVEPAAPLPKAWTVGLTRKMASGIRSVVAEHACIGPQLTQQAKAAAEAAARRTALGRDELLAVVNACMRTQSLGSLATAATQDALAALRVAAEKLSAKAPAPATASAAAAVPQAGLHRKRAVSDNPSLTARAVLQQALADLGETETASAGAGATAGGAATGAGVAAPEAGVAAFPQVSRLLLVLMRRRIEATGEAFGAVLLVGASEDSAPSAAVAAEAAEAAPMPVLLRHGPEAELLYAGMLTHAIAEPFDKVCEALSGILGRAGAAAEAEAVQDIVPLPVVVPAEPPPLPRAGRGAAAAAAAEDAAPSESGAAAQASQQTTQWLAAPAGGEREAAAESAPAAKSFASIALPLFLAVLALVQAWAGLLGVMFGLYLTAGEAFLPGKGDAADTIGVTCGFGAAMLVFGAAGYVMAREGRWAVAVALVVLALGAEAGAISLMVVNNMPFLRDAAIVVLGFQALPGLLALVGAGMIAYVQRQLLVRTQQVLERVAAIRADEEQLAAVVHVQRAYRSFHAHNRLVRLREMRNWDDLRPARRAVLAMLYACVALIGFFSFYICLIFGVVFTAEQSRAWIISSLISFAIEIVITAPLVELGMTILHFFRDVKERSARDVAILSLAEAKGVDLDAEDAPADAEQPRTPGKPPARPRHRGARSSLAFADLLVEPSRRNLAPAS